MSNYNPAGGGLQYRGTKAGAPPNCNFFDRDPTQYDKNNVSLLDQWLNTTTNDVFILVSLAGSSTSMGSRATWVKISTGQVGVFTINGIMPDGSGNINIDGIVPINVSNDQPSNTINISVDVATDTSVGVVQLASNAVAIAGVDDEDAITAASLAAKLGTQTTNGVAYGAGTAAAINWTAAGNSSPTVPQVLIAHTGGIPAFGSITSAGSTIAITYNNGTNTINLEADEAADISVQTTDATPTTLYSLAVSTNQAVTLYCDIIGATADYSAAIGGNVEATARRGAGSLTMVGSPVVNLNEDSAGSPDFTIVVSGNNLIIQVTGVAATTYNWKGLVRQALISV
jgi:hypothetical protein